VVRELLSRGACVNPGHALARAAGFGALAVVRDLLARGAAYALTLAAGKDFEPGTKLQAELEKKMSKEQLAEAQKEFERLKAKPAPAKESPAPAAKPDKAPAKK
jgi:hypothetical protein